MSLLLPDVVTAYRLTAALATIGTLLIVIRISREHLALSVTSTLAAVFLYAASGHVQRSLFFPQTDALATFFFALAVDCALVFRASARPRDFFLLVATVTLALFTKLSALPLPLIAGLAILWPSGSDESPSTLRLPDRLVYVMLLGLIPVALVGGYAAMLQTFDNYLVELAVRGTEDVRFTRHAIAAVTALLPLLVALIISRNQGWSTTERILLACVGIYLLSLWGGGGSGWDRFYLNVQPVALPLAVKRFERCRELREPAVTLPLAIAYLLAHAFRMELGLYY